MLCCYTNVAFENIGFRAFHRAFSFARTRPYVCHFCTLFWRRDVQRKLRNQTSIATLDLYQSRVSSQQYNYVYSYIHSNHVLTHSSRCPRTLSGRPTLGLYESFQEVLIRRGRRQYVASTLRANETYELRSTDAGT